MAQDQVLTPEEQPKPAFVKRGKGRPPASEALQAKDQNQQRFLDAINKIEEADWGTRATIWLYRLEPYTDRKRSGEPVNLMQYAEAVDEGRVMMEFGSGRYRFLLTMRKPSGQRGEEVCRYEFEINNPSYPPKIALGDWVDDHRNKKWAWAKPKGDAANVAPAAPPQTTVSALREVLEVNEMIKEQVEAARPETPPQKSETEQLGGALGVVKTLLEIAGPSKGDAVLAMMQTELAAIREQANKKDERIEKLIDELRKKPESVPAPPAPDPMEQMTKSAENFKKMREIFSPEKPQEQQQNSARRSNMPWWAEMLQPAMTELAGAAKEILPALMSARQQSPPRPPTMMQPQALPAPAQPNANPAPPQTSEDPQPFMEWLFLHSLPALTFCFDNEQPGGEFAEWLYQSSTLDEETNMPSWVNPQSMKKVPWLKIAKELKAENLITIYKQSPFWPLIASKGEEQFTKFLTEFVAWEPPKEEPPAEDFFAENKEQIA